MNCTLKMILSYLKSAPSTAKFSEKTKAPEFGIKNILLGYFWTRISKNYWICLIATFRRKTNMPKFGYFWTRISKNYCHIRNQHLWICLKVKFCEETKMLNFGTLVEYFWPKMPYLGISGLEFKQKLLWYLKSAPLNLSNCKIL